MGIKMKQIIIMVPMKNPRNMDRTKKKVLEGKAQIQRLYDYISIPA